MTVIAQALVNGLMIGGVYALVAIGLTLIFGVMRIINFAHGEFVMLGAYVSYWLFIWYKVDPFLSLLATSLLLGPLGWALQKFLVARVLKADHLNQILLTLGVSITLQNLALVAFSADYVSVNTAYASASVHLGPLTIGLTRGLAFLVSLAFSGGLYLSLTRTELGRTLRAVAQNRDSATLVGIDVEQTYLIAFALAGALAGAAGALTSVLVYTFPRVGFSYVTKAFAVVVLGGLGSVPGAFLGSMILGVTESLVGSFIPAGGGWAEGASFALIILTLLVKPKGIFGVD